MKKGFRLLHQYTIYRGLPVVFRLAAKKMVERRFVSLLQCNMVSALSVTVYSTNYFKSNN